MQAEVHTVQELGALLRDRRRRTGMTQQVLAETSGVSRRWVSGVETGRNASVDFYSVLKVLETLDLVLSVVDDPDADFISVFDVEGDE